MQQKTEKIKSKKIGTVMNRSLQINYCREQSVTVPDSITKEKKIWNLMHQIL